MPAEDLVVVAPMPTPFRDDDSIDFDADAGARLIRVRVPRLTRDVGGYFQQLVPRMPVPVVVIHQMAPGQFLAAPTAAGASAELLSDVATMDNVFAYIASDNLRFESRVASRIAGQGRFWACNGSLLLTMAAMGARGACLMLGNVAPQFCREILSRIRDQQLEPARMLHEILA